jgi:hypothetical protein
MPHDTEYAAAMLLSGPTKIAGVDGCKAGWIAVTAALGSFGKPEVKIFESVAALIAELAPKSLIAIDMPIGLPERAIRGGREPDWAARQFLGFTGRPQRAKACGIAPPPHANSLSLFAACGAK